LTTKKTRLIGLGNSILTDDGVGVVVARRLQQALPMDCGLDIVESEVGGFDLMEMLVGFTHVILVDAVQFDGVAPGTIVRIKPEDLHTSLRLRSVHEIDLPTVLGLGKELGYAMPESIEIYAIQAQDMITFGERLNPCVAAAAEQVIREITAQAVS